MNRASVWVLIIALWAGSANLTFAEPQYQTEIYSARDKGDVGIDRLVGKHLRSGIVR